jgi:hypothetical protein
MEEWGYSSAMLNLDARWRWSASCPCYFTPGETALSAHCIGGWVGPIMEKNPYPLPGIELQLFGCLAHFLVAILTEIFLISLVKSGMKDVIINFMMSEVCILTLQFLFVVPILNRLFIVQSCALLMYKSLVFCALNLRLFWIFHRLFEIE